MPYVSPPGEHSFRLAKGETISRIRIQKLSSTHEQAVYSPWRLAYRPHRHILGIRLSKSLPVSSYLPLVVELFARSDLQTYPSLSGPARQIALLVAPDTGQR